MKNETNIPEQPTIFGQICSVFSAVAHFLGERLGNPDPAIRVEQLSQEDEVSVGSTFDGVDLK